MPIATQSGELSSVLIEDMTSDRDESPGERQTGEHAPAHQLPEGSLSRDISRAMVNLLKDYLGRGASHAQAYIHQDLVVVVMRRTMTKAERTLAAEGEQGLVRDVRHALQGKFGEEANGIVERLTGRHVVAFLSDHDVDKDVLIQAFVLEPGANGH